MCRCRVKKRRRMDGEPPPFLAPPIDDNTVPHPFTVDDDDDFKNLVIPSHLPNVESSPSPVFPKQKFPHSPVSNSSDCEEFARDTSSIPEYASTWDEDTTTELNDMPPMEVIKVKKAKDLKVNKLGINSPDMSGITEAPTLESEVQEPSSPLTEEASSRLDNGFHLNNEKDVPNVITNGEMSHTNSPVKVDEEKTVAEVITVIEKITVSEESTVAEEVTVQLEGVSPLEEPESVEYPAVEVEAEEDEFGDFSDFTVAQSSQDPSVERTVVEAVKEDNCDSEWSAFGSAGDPKSTNDNEKEGTANDDWAAFSAATGDTTQPSSTQDDDWGDFDAAPPPAPITMARSVSQDKTRASINDDDWDDAEFTSAAPVTVAQPMVPECSLPSLEELRESDDVYEFEDMEEVEEDHQVFAIRETFDKENADEILGDLARSSASLWMALRVIEEAISLKYNWTDSKLQSALLKVLKVDPTFVGRSSSLPPLKTDTVLTPTPLRDDNTNRGGRPVTISSTGRSAAHLTSTASSASANHQQSSGSSGGTHHSGHSKQPRSSSSGENEKQKWFGRRSFRFWKQKDSAEKNRSRSMSPPPSSSLAASSTTPIDSLSVPPADFDWANSGLTNPLKGQGSASSHSSALLDVDFFTSNGHVTGASSASTLEKDLDAFGLSATGASKTVSSVSQQSTLDVLLSSQRPAHKFKPVSELSLDAKALHDQLPDIDFLKARMIMFPIGGRSGENRE